MDQRKKIAIYGCGGFAREVAWLLSTIEKHESLDFLGYVEDDCLQETILDGKPVLSWDNFERAHSGSLVTVAVGSPLIRRRLAEKCMAAGFSFATLVHHSVEMSDSVSLGEGAIVCCGSILTVNIQVERHVHINLDCTIGHDVHIGEFTMLFSGVYLSGNVHIGKSVFIGTGVSIINGVDGEPLVIGDGAVIGAGACVIRSVEAHCLFAGVPAELKKRY